MTMIIFRPPLIQTVVEDIDSCVNPCQSNADRSYAKLLLCWSLPSGSFLRAHGQAAPESQICTSRIVSYPYGVWAKLVTWHGTALFQTCLCQTNVQSQDGSSSVVLSVGVLSAPDRKKKNVEKRRSDHMKVSLVAPCQRTRKSCNLHYQSIWYSYRHIDIMILYHFKLFHLSVSM